jgi:Fe-S-cluster containining protein
MIQTEQLESFRCKRCGQCCRESGYVKLSEQDAEQIANFLHMDVATFVQEQTRLMPDRSSLALLEREDGACVFLSDDGCCVLQNVKPQQCKDFPYKWRYTHMNEICKGWEL